MTEPPAQTEASALRARLTYLGGAVVILAALVGVIALARSGPQSPDASPAPGECLRSWNSDPETLAAGRHLAVAHNYTEAQVGYLVPGGDTITDERDGRECVVVFARTTLDPEVEAAGEIELKGDWTPLSAVARADQLSAMQRAAFAGANARPTEEGKLAPR